MAFQWERAGVSNLYVVPADGSTAARALTTDDEQEWSPDGTKLVYQHTDPESPADLFVIDATAEGALPVVSERDQGLRTSVM